MGTFSVHDGKPSGANPEGWLAAVNAGLERWALSDPGWDQPGVAGHNPATVIYDRKSDPEPDPLKFLKWVREQPHFRGTQEVATSMHTHTVVIAVPATIDTQPANQTVTAGQAATFETAASPDSQCAFQWQKKEGNAFVDLADGGNFSGVTTKKLMVAGDPSLNNTFYRCVVLRTQFTGTVSMKCTKEAKLTVNAP